MKKRIGVFIGRFQPPHKGHTYAIKKCLEYVDLLIIGIGSSNKNDINNPLSSRIRKKMIQKIIQEKNLTKKIKKIIVLADHPDDNTWLKNTLKKTGRITVVFGNNEWVNGIFEEAGFTVKRVGFLKRNIYEGTKIRKLIKEKKHWEKRVESFLIASIKKQEF